LLFQTPNKPGVFVPGYWKYLVTRWH